MGQQKGRISTNVYLNPEELDRLRALSERTRVPMSAYIREGIDIVLKKYGEKK
jgi:predicted DNA-binding protein